jgi:hypothetical protein
MKLLAIRARRISNCSSEVVARDGLIEPKEAGQTTQRGVRGDLATLPSQVRSDRLGCRLGDLLARLTPDGW